MSLPDKNFKDLVCQFPTGICIIITSFRNKFYGFTANSFTSVSLNPKLISFCLNRTSRSYEAFNNCDNLLITFLSNSQKVVAEQFSSNCDNKFLGLEYTFSEKFKFPLINNSLGFIECKNYSRYKAGDHTVFICEVLGGKIHENERPLLYYNRKYHTEW